MRIRAAQLRQLVSGILHPSQFLLAFLFGSAGREYGVGIFRKITLLFKILRNASHPWSATSFLEQVILVQGVLAVPKELNGAVAEFGCYKGASTASLSLACAMTNRRLIVFDSFEGLPEIREEVSNIGDQRVLQYKARDYCGTLNEVKHNVREWGDIRVCEFVKGFFDDTLSSRNSEELYVLVFEDVDLPSSVRTVLRWVWPRLHDGCTFFSHEARDKEVVELFFDNVWWKNTLGCRSPGFIGSGVGLPLNAWGSCLGYTVKLRALPSLTAKSRYPVLSQAKSFGNRVA